MKKLSLIYFLVPAICFCGAYAFFYLNSLDVKLSQKHHVSNVPIENLKNTNTVNTICSKETLSDTSKSSITLKNNKENVSGSSYLPATQIMKFFIQKGIEGLPILNIRDYLSFFK